MSKQDINKKEFTEETKLKLEIFRECFREWFPVFVHNPYISNIFIYDMFAGSGKDSVGNLGSPRVLFQEARGDKKQHCQSLLRPQSPKITFGFNELESSKKKELELTLSADLQSCRRGCSENKCPFDSSFYYESKDFSSLIDNKRLNFILKEPKFAKFILLDQYGFKEINNDVFLKLVDSPTTDFIFFIASSFVRRFKTLPAVTNYFKENLINFDESKPKECHKVIADYFRNLIPQEKNYYIHSFTIQKGANYYGLIFGSGHSLGMEKFVKVCWKHDKLAGESNCNVYDDFEPGTLFYNPQNSNKRKRVYTDIKEKILNHSISNNKQGLDYALRRGCEPKLYVEVIDALRKEGKIRIEGKFNRQATNIHNVGEYKIVLT